MDLKGRSADGKGQTRRRRLLLRQERSEDGVSVLERVVNDVDEVVGVGDLVEEVPGWRSLVVESGPLLSDGEGFVLPGDEGDTVRDEGREQVSPRKGRTKAERKGRTLRRCCEHERRRGDQVSRSNEDTKRRRKRTNVG